jgi:hypothetical protein
VYLLAYDSPLELSTLVATASFRSLSVAIIANYASVDARA